MWKMLFDLGDMLFAIVPNKKWRDFLRTNVLFDYKRKLNALKSACPDLDFKNMRLSKGGGSLVFIIGNDTFKVRKYNSEVGNFARFEREKRITDAIRPWCTIQIPNIEFIDKDGITFYKTTYIPGELLINIPTRKIKKHQKQISKQLAEFIYKKSLAHPVGIEDLRGKVEHDNFSWIHGDMCSNILIDPKTMKITGIIDWEWAGYNKTEYEFNGLVRVRKKMQKIGLDKTTLSEYNKIVNKK